MGLRKWVKSWYGNPDPHSIDHLTRIPWRLQAAARIEDSVFGYFFGTFGVVWLPIAAAFVFKFPLEGASKDTIVNWALALGLLQLASGLVAYGAKKHSELSAGVTAVHALHEFLDWMHGEVFSGNTNTRITIMVPVQGDEGPELRVFLRPSAFPSWSKTKLRVQGNKGIREGAAGTCFCAALMQRIPVPPDPLVDEAAYVTLS